MECSIVPIFTQGSHSTQPGLWLVSYAAAQNISKQRFITFACPSVCVGGMRMRCLFLTSTLQFEMFTPEITHKKEVTITHNRGRDSMESHISLLNTSASKRALKRHLSGINSPKSVLAQAGDAVYPQNSFKSIGIHGELADTTSSPSYQSTPVT